MTAKEALLMEFATRKNVATLTTVDRAEKLVGSVLSSVQRRDVIACFRGLEADGHGRFLCGRKGCVSRFLWGDGCSRKAYFYYYQQQAA